MNEPDPPDRLEDLSDEEILRLAEKLSAGGTGSPPPPADSPEKARQGLELVRRALGSELAGDPSFPQAVRGSARLGPGDLVAGRYRLLEILGEGGMGSVWAAEQTGPVRRRVALKLVKAGMDSRQVLARFEAERQALAAMDHPNIARIFDGGLTGAQTPFFAMELVEGTHLTAFCDQSLLGIRERMELFAQIILAVQHAHQKGIIHRDLKPSNILVSVIDGRPVPKVIDFGLAKALQGPLTGQSLATGFGSVVGTLEYMSPEQAGSGGCDIDTRADIYSLGVILYELLTGLLPFDSERLQQAALDEMLRIIREEEPLPPSARISSSGLSPSAAAVRRTGPVRLSGLLRNELDWIVMKALEKDRCRRYETADGMAADIRRYLAGEPVLAHPPGRLYRLQKYAAKNRGLVLGGTLVLAALVLGLATTLWQAGVARRAAARADERATAAEVAENEQRRLAAAEADQRREAVRQRELADQAAAAESERAAELEKVASFQAAMLGQIDTTAAGAELMEDLRDRLAAALEKSSLDETGRAARNGAFARDLALLNATDTATAILDRSILRPAVEAIERDFPDQPLVAASLRQSLALLYRDLGRYSEAIPLQRSALEIRKRELGEDHRRSITSLDELGLLLQYAGKPAESEPYSREALERKLRLFGEEFEGTLIAMNNVGLLLEAQGKLAEAEPLLRKAVETARRVLGEEHAHTLDFTGNLALVLDGSGQTAAAEPLAREVLEKQRKISGPNHKATLLAMNNLALFLKKLDRLEEARALFEECLDATRQTMGEEHPQTLAAIHNLGWTLLAMERIDEAEPFYRQSMEMHRKVLGAKHPSSILATNNMASLLQTRGQLEQALLLREEVLALSREVLGTDHDRTLTAAGNLAGTHEAMGHPEFAEPLRREVMESTRRIRPEGHVDTLQSTLDWANTLRLLDRQEDADPLFREALAGLEKLRGPDHPSVGTAHLRLGQNLLAQKRFAESAAGLNQAERIYSAHPTLRADRKRELFRTLAELHAAWELAEPDRGHAALAGSWRERLNAMESDR